MTTTNDGERRPPEITTPLREQRNRTRDAEDDQTRRDRAREDREHHDLDEDVALLRRTEDEQTQQRRTDEDDDLALLRRAEDEQRQQRRNSEDQQRQLRRRTEDEQTQQRRNTEDQLRARRLEQHHQQRRAQDESTQQRRHSEDRARAGNQTAPSPPEHANTPASSAVGAPQQQLPIPDYDQLSAGKVNQRLAELSGTDLDLIESHERATKARKSVLAKISALRP